MVYMVHNDPEMIQTLEVDLQQKAADAFVAQQVTSLVHGVFSIDDLEKKTEQDLNRGIAVGVQYSGAQWVEIDFKNNTRGSPAADGGAGAKMLAYTFIVILAVPTGENCEERYNGTKLLTVLRRSIHGSQLVSGDQFARRWNFISERPEVEASTDTMLYYVQVWQAALPLVGLPRVS